MSVHPLTAPVVVLSLAAGALALPQFSSAEEHAIEREAIVVESNNRSSIVFVPRDTGGQAERASASSAKDGKVEVVPVKAEMSSLKEKAEGSKR